MPIEHSYRADTEGDQAVNWLAPRRARGDRIMIEELVILYLLQIPLVIVWLTGMILAIRYWLRQPRVSLLTFIAMIIFLVQLIVTRFYNFYPPQPRVLLDLGRERSQEISLSILRISDAILSVTAWILVIFAIFGRRQPQIM